MRELPTASELDLKLEAVAELAALAACADKMNRALAKSAETLKGSVATTVVEDDYKTVTYPTSTWPAFVTPSHRGEFALQAMADAITNKDAQKYAEACAALWKANVS